MATKQKHSEIVKKNTSAIHIDAKLTLYQRRLSNALLLNAYDTLLTKKEHEIDEATLCAMIGYEGKNTKHLRTALKGLVSTPIEWSIFDEKGKEQYGTSSLLASAELYNGVCKYEYSSKLAEKLYNPETYARINLAVQRLISSGHSLALYENCYRFINVGTTGWWSIEDLRRIFGVSGEDYYKDFKRFNNKIIKPSVAEINRTSNIIIEPEFKREARKIAYVRFSVKENPQLSMIDLEEDDSINQTRTYKRLLRKGISKVLARQWILDYGEPYINEKLDITDNFEKRKNTKSSASGFLVEAVRTDYKTEKTELKKAVTELEEKKQTEDREKLEIEALSNRILMIDKRYRDLGTVRIETEISKLSESEAKEIEESFIASLDGAEILIERFKKGGWGTPYLWSRVIEFWKARGMDFPDKESFALENGYPSYEEAKARKKALEENMNL